jgi:histidinol dehydrogenase
VAQVLASLDLRGTVGDVAASLPRPQVDGDEPIAVVRGLLDQVRTGGDAALIELTERFDGVRLESIAVDHAELLAARDRIPTDLRAALELAADRIAAFHRTQLHAPAIYAEGGAVIRSFDVPVDRAGCYVPGGTAPLASTLLMTAVPARVAGVPAVVVCSPPSRQTGRVDDVILAAAAIAGVDEFYAIGGAQAIGAMAYGTETIAPVDVVCGPGNKYVAIAKREVAGTVGVAAAFAGPSEVVVIADGSVDPRFAAIDVIVQAEHGPDGLAWLVTWDPEVAKAVDAAIEELVAVAPRADQIRSTLASCGYAVVVDDEARAVQVANAIAPEHLQLMVTDPAALLPLIRNAGATFVGPWSPASMGDYVAGPSHVLPTHGTARFSSALTVSDFTKHHHVIELDRAAFDELAPHVATLARAEGLDAHAQSVLLRAASDSEVVTDE